MLTSKFEGNLGQNCWQHSRESELLINEVPEDQLPAIHTAFMDLRADYIEMGRILNHTYPKTISYPHATSIGRTCSDRSILREPLHLLGLHSAV